MYTNSRADDVFYSMITESIKRRMVVVVHHAHMHIYAHTHIYMYICMWMYAPI
jgi:hypothetical protein